MHVTNYKVRQKSKVTVFLNVLRTVLGLLLALRHVGVVDIKGRSLYVHSRSVRMPQTEVLVYLRSTVDVEGHQRLFVSLKQIGEVSKVSTGKKTKVVGI